jgi:hypothetical protein
MAADLDGALNDFLNKMRQKPISPEMDRADKEIAHQLQELGKIHEETSKLIVCMNQTFSQKITEFAAKIAEFEQRLGAKPEK